MVTRYHYRLTSLSTTHQLLAIHERDVEDIAEREDRIKGKWQVDESKGAGRFLSLHFAFIVSNTDVRECQYLVFRFVKQPSARPYASTSALFNGHELHFPLVVFDCVEELYRTCTHGK
jgi:hypothetical protein